MSSQNGVGQKSLQLHTFFAVTFITCTHLIHQHKGKRQLLQVHTHTCLTALFPGLPGWASTRKVKPIWILLKQETVSGSGISWAVYKSAPCFRQITMPASHHSVFYRPDALPAAQPTTSKHWRHAAAREFVIATTQLERILVYHHFSVFRCLMWQHCLHFTTALHFFIWHITCKLIAVAVVFLFYILVCH